MQTQQTIMYITLLLFRTSFSLYLNNLLLFPTQRSIISFLKQFLSKSCHSIVAHWQQDHKEIWSWMALWVSVVVWGYPNAPPFSEFTPWEHLQAVIVFSLTPSSDKPCVFFASFSGSKSVPSFSLSVHSLQHFCMFLK